MLRNVAYHVLQFTFLFSILIIAFAFSFYLLFNKYSEISAAEDSALAQDDSAFFSNFGLSIIKIIVMLTGELDDGRMKFEIFTVTRHLIFLLFVLLMYVSVFSIC